MLFRANGRGIRFPLVEAVKAVSLIFVRRGLVKDDGLSKVLFEMIYGGVDKEKLLEAVGSTLGFKGEQM